MTAPFLECRQVTRSFGAVRALDGVDFIARPGEVTALVGDNGAGKSTLIKGIAGIHPFGSGELRLGGEPREITDPRAAASAGVAVVYQDLALADNLDVVGNLFLGRELTRGGSLDEIRMEERCLELLESLAVTTLQSVRAPVATLSGGQRQAIAVARAVMGDPSLVILDEPTAALGVPQTKQVLALVRRLAEQGRAVVLVTHNLEDLFRVADRITVLRLGRNAGEFDVAATTKQDVVHAITSGGGPA
ncbi:MAG: sugar ABC transporter ATP-binding protein [Gemmatimonadetes bacterium]|nr:sugar ABC transporter ATP-binding protein [Gemmatimonadota bacterium]